METHLGPYRLLEPIAEGGQGAVWRAVDPNGAAVAVKTLHQTDHESLKRFRQEAAVLANLTHPNLPRIYAQGATSKTAWLAFELIEGESLFERVRRDGRQPIPWTARTLAAVADALEHCHQRGLVHRDVKPTNVVIERGTDRPVLVDFGLVKRDPAQMPLAIDDQTLFSLSGSIKGTPEFMAPEQIDASFGAIGPATDVHALGALLYGLLTASLPFGVASDLGVYGVMHRVLREPPPDPLRIAPDLDPALVRFCLGCLSKSPGDRPISASSFKRDLLLLAGLPTSTASTATLVAPEDRSSSALALAAVALAALLIGGLVWGALQESASPTEPMASSTTPPPAGAQTPSPAEAPWGTPATGWNRVWALGASPPARLEPSAAWDDAAGTRTDPLRPVRTAAVGDRVPGFNGEATALGDGRVRLRYDLRLAEVAYARPLNVFLLGDATSGRSGGGSRPVRLRVPNDVEALRLRVGRTVWAEPELSCTYRLISPVDRERLRLGVNTKGGLADLNLIHRRATITARVQTKAGPESRGVQFAQQRGRSRTIRFAPCASDSLARVQVDQQTFPVLGPLLDAGPRSGRVIFEVSEIDLEVQELTVVGRPTSTDRPTRALVDPPRSSSLRVAAAFERLGPQPGGPCLGLGPHQLELDRDMLRLSSAARGLVAVAQLPRAPDGGWLSLTREGDTVRALAVIGGERFELRVSDPLAGSPAPVHYGSSGPPLRFTAVEVWLGPDDPSRRASDAPIPAATPSPRDRWRRAARRVASVTNPSQADARTFGPRQASRRAAVARGAAGELLQVAGLLPPPAAHDAIARAVLAYASCGDADQAEAAARRLVRSAGLSAAKSVVDAFHIFNDRPRLTDDLLRGWASVRQHQPRAAGHRVAAILAPDRKAEAYLGLSECLSAGRRPETKTGQAALREALRLAELAHRLGHPNPQRALGRRAELHTQLREYRQALVLWDQAMTQGVEWWAALRRSECLEGLGRFDEALSSIVIGYAAERHPLVIRVMRRLAARPGAAGIRAVACWLLNDRAAAIAAIQRSRSESPRQRDLGAYVARALEQPTPLPTGSRPTAILVRAKAQDPAALRALAQARQDLLVEALVLLDPAFASVR